MKLIPKALLGIKAEALPDLSFLTTKWAPVLRDIFNSARNKRQEELQWKTMASNYISLFKDSPLNSNAKDKEYLINYIYNNPTRFGRDAILYSMATESGFNPYEKNKSGSTGIGFALMLENSYKIVYPEKYLEIMSQYKNKSRSILDAVEDAYQWYNRLDERLTDGDMNYGRLKVNLLAPNASLTSRVPDNVRQYSLTKAQKKLLAPNGTYLDLMNIYNTELNNELKR